MRRDYLIAIILAVAAIPCGTALMVAPEYLHLTGIALAVTFWGGVILTIMLVVAAVVIALRGEAKSPPKGHRRRIATIIGLAVFALGFACVVFFYAPWPAKEMAVVVPRPTVPMPPMPTQSRLNRFIFDCDVPPPQTFDEEVKQQELLQKNIQAWADTIGISVSFSQLQNGTQITIEAKTKDAKARFISMGIVQGITKIILEARSIERRKIVVARAEVPKRFQIFAEIVPEPSAQQIIDGQKLIARFLGAPENACRLI